MTLVRWQDVAMWDDESDEPIVDESIRRAKLSEYRSTGAIAGVWFVSPAGRSAPDERDAMSHEGPSVDEIDWLGFAS